jgi:hypothetical protein
MGDAGPPDVSVGVEIACAPQRAWDAVSDPRSLVALSPEASRVRSTAVGALQEGDTFAGANRNGAFRWSTRCRVVESRAPEAFAFDVSYLGLSVARWRYVVAASGSGTHVDEQWWDHRGWFMTALGVVGTGVIHRREHNTRTMRATLDALKSRLESTET